MALKMTIYEKCSNCGKRAATLCGEKVSIWHKCENPPPGPRDAPSAPVHISSIHFVRGEWTAEELAKELDEANTEIGRLQDEVAKFKWPLREIRNIVGKVTLPE